MGVNKVVYAGTTLVDLSSDTVSSDKMLSGATAHGSNGEVVTGNIPNNGTITGSIDGINTKSVAVPAGYTSGGTVSLTNDIDNEVDTQADLISQISTTLANKSLGAVPMQIATGSYKGSGQSSATSKTLTFDFEPKVVMIHPGTISNDSMGKFGPMILIRGAEYAPANESNHTETAAATAKTPYVKLTWSGTSVTISTDVSWSSVTLTNQALHNYYGFTYYYVAIG